MNQILIFTLIFCLVVAFIYCIYVYNMLVKNKNLVLEAWSGIDVQLKQRHELIPNLVAIVKGYMQYEDKLLVNLTKTRTAALNAGKIAEQGKNEGLLTQLLNQLIISVENYPDLKADEKFLELQKKLADVENLLQHARRYYNGAVRQNNIAIDSFPSNILAKLFQFKAASFFELNDPSERKVPDLDLH